MGCHLSHIRNCICPSKRSQENRRSSIRLPKVPADACIIFLPTTTWSYLAPGGNVPADECGRRAKSRAALPPLDAVPETRFDGAPFGARRDVYQLVERGELPAGDVPKQVGERVDDG